MTLKMTLATMARPNFVVGRSTLAYSGSGTSNGLSWISLESPAPRAGTLTQVKFLADGGGGCRVFTGSLSGSTFTVRAVQSLTAASVGSTTVQTAGTGLAVQPGDYIGFYAESGSAATINLFSSSGSGSLLLSFGAPTAGGTLSTSANSGQINLQGIGS